MKKSEPVEVNHIGVLTTGSACCRRFNWIVAFQRVTVLSGRGIRGSTAALAVRSTAALAVTIISLVVGFFGAVAVFTVTPLLISTVTPTCPGIIIVVVVVVTAVVVVANNDRRDFFRELCRNV